MERCLNEGAEAEVVNGDQIAVEIEDLIHC